MKDKIELLSPAGNMEALKAAVSAGCDAVYLGLQNYSARAFAGNFSHEEFIEAISYCHIRDVKIYVTMNTMLYETEIEKSKKEIDFIYQNDADGVLIQDLGLFHYVRTCYPDLDVHCSTQMHVHNLAGVRFMQEQGAKRAVLARETPIELVEQACRIGIPIEVFVYGAICISYSGQCLMSSVMKKRSANRGMCAQCCRLKYDLNGKKKAKHEYLLSPKDLNVIDEIPALIEAGVSSLKIEGRMKRPEYVWLVTKTFREAIDAYYEGRSYRVDPQRNKELMLMFNRGFSKGHLFHASTAERMSQFRPNHQGIEIGKVVQYQRGRVQVTLTAPLHQHDGLRIINEPSDTGLTAVKIYDQNENLVNHAEAGETVWLDCHDLPIPKAGQKLHKTSDAVLLKSIDEKIAEPEHTIPIMMKYTAEIDAPFCLQIIDHDGHCVSVSSEQTVQAAKNAPLLANKIEASLRKVGDLPYLISSIQGTTGNIFLPVSAVNEVRRQGLEELSRQRASVHIRKGRKEYHLDLASPEAPTEKDLIFCRCKEHMVQTDIYTQGYGKHQIAPVVNQNGNQASNYENTILSSVSDLAGEHHACIAGMTLNIANSYAMAYIYSLKGINGIIVSSEMDENNIQMSIDAFVKRYGFRPYLYQFIYGRRTLMYIKDGFTDDPEAKYISDLQKKSCVVQKNGDTSEILEPDIIRKENHVCYGTYKIIQSADEYHKMNEENE
jgi:putative protease